MLSGLGLMRRSACPRQPMRCLAKGGFGGTATKQQGKSRKASRRVAKVEKRKEREAESPYDVLQRDALESLHQHLASGVTQPQDLQPDTASERRFDEQNTSRLRSSLFGSTVGAVVLDVEQRELQREQGFLGSGRAAGPAASAAALGVIDAEFEPVLASDSGATGPAGSSTAAPQRTVFLDHKEELAGEASSSNGTRGSVVADGGELGGQAADAGTQGPTLLTEEELAGRIARLWDDVPDELRELMDSTEEPGLDAAISAAAPEEDPLSNFTAGGPTAPASSVGRAKPGFSSDLPDLDALLAPLQPKTAPQADFDDQDYQEPLRSTAEHSASSDSNESMDTIDTIDYSNITEHLVDAAEMEALLASAHAAADKEAAAQQAADEEDGGGSIGSVRVMALQQEVASANKKVELLEQQLQISEEHARLLSQELKLLQLQHEAGPFTAEQQPGHAHHDHHEQQHQLLSGLEVQVAQIANELLMVSLSMKNIDTAERRQLRQIVNELLALKFSTDNSH